MQQPLAAEDRTDAAPRLLLVDDSDDQRQLLSRLLRARGFEVDEAADGRSALLAVKGRRCDLVLLDLQMPGVDGFEVLSYLQKNRPEQRVILLSGLPLDQIGDGIARLPQKELPTLLLKPVDTAQLLKVVELELAGDLP